MWGVAAEKEQDSVYEVLFDDEFLGGLTIRFVKPVICGVSVVFFFKFSLLCHYGSMYNFNLCSFQNFCHNEIHIMDRISTLTSTQLL